MSHRNPAACILSLILLLASASCSNPTVSDDPGAQERPTHGLNGDFFNLSPTPNDHGCDAYFESANTYDYQYMDTGVRRTVREFHTVGFFNRANDPYPPGSKVRITVDDSLLVPYGTQGTPGLVSHSLLPFPEVLQWNVVGDADIPSFQTSVEAPAPLTLDTSMIHRHDSISAVNPGVILFHGGTDTICGQISSLFKTIILGDTSYRAGEQIVIQNQKNTGSFQLPEVFIPPGAVNGTLSFQASSIIGKVIHVGSREILVRSAASISVAIPIALHR